MKTTSDLGIPVIGVGLLFQQGYFRQMIDAAGWQHEAYPYNEPATMPVEPVLAPDGSRLHVSIELPGRSLHLRIWRASVGRVALYLLDSNSTLNSAADRGITGALYAGGTQMRLMQEIALGIGGWRLVEALHPEVEVCHMNEGHAASQCWSARVPSRHAWGSASARHSGRHEPATSSPRIHPSMPASIASRSNCSNPTVPR